MSFYKHIHFLPFIIFLLLFSCEEKKVIKEKGIDLAEIKKRGKLIVLTENSTLSYIEYRDKQMGFEYEILDSFARSMHVPLEIKVVSNWNEMLQFLRKGEGDIIAGNLAVTLHHRDLEFSAPYYESYQVLVQLNTDSVITEPSQLAGKEVYVRKYSSYNQRLRHLEDEIGDSIHIRFPKEDMIVEDLVELVIKKKICFTVAHENLARLAKEQNPNLFIRTKMSFLQKMAFGLRHNSPQLKKELDVFLEKYTNSDGYLALKQKYFDYLDAATTEILPIGKGQLSPYDKIFKKVAKAYKWDWKLLAAVSYKESRFNPYTRGAGGAFGLMQFMPHVGPLYGVYPHSNPEIQIKGGMKLLNNTYMIWAGIPDKAQRIKFTLASYNAGTCHIKDAQRLAAENGFDPLIWDDNVEVMVEKLDDPRFYRSEKIECGAYRGHAVDYVETVYNRYLSWK